VAPHAIVSEQIRHEHRVAAVPLAHELADVELASLAHVGRAGVAEVGVMCPDNHLCAASLPRDIGDECVERLDHVSIAQVPGRNVAEKHRAVMRLRAFHYAGILHG
jgi:hypothetical protein